MHRKKICEFCGLKQTPELPTFHVHHCGMAKTKETKYDWKSFVTLCPECHYKTQELACMSKKFQEEALLLGVIPLYLVEIYRNKAKEIAKKNNGWREKP